MFVTTCVAACLTISLFQTALFGSGIYLSTELNMSLSYSKIGQTWDKSRVGSQMSCVVLSEVIDHPDVKLHTDGKKLGSINPGSRMCTLFAQFKQITGQVSSMLC